MRMDIQLPSHEVFEVELEYEKLEKHCLFCKSLAHEDGHCHLCPSRQHQEERRHLRIFQRNTLTKIEEDKRRQDDMKHARIQQYSHKDGARWPNYRGAENIADLTLSLSLSLSHSLTVCTFPKWIAEKLWFRRKRTRYDHKSFSRHSSPPLRRTSPHQRTPSFREAAERNSSASRLQIDGPLALEPSCRPRTSPNKGISSRSNQSSVTSVAKIFNLASRLSNSRVSPQSGGERVSAKERLSIHS